MLTLLFIAVVTAAVAAGTFAVREVRRVTDLQITEARLLIEPVQQAVVVPPPPVRDTLWYDVVGIPFASWFNARTPEQLAWLIEARDRFDSSNPFAGMEAKR